MWVLSTSCYAAHSHTASTSNIYNMCTSLHAGRESGCNARGLSASAVTRASMRSMGSSTRARESRESSHAPRARKEMTKMEREMLRMAWGAVTYMHGRVICCCWSWQLELCARKTVMVKSAKL